MRARPAAPPGMVPPLPPAPVRAGWHRSVREWWERIWTSAVATQWIDVDLDGLYLIARLRHDFATTKSFGVRKQLASEIRLQERRFGLDVMSRRSLQWDLDAEDGAPSTPGGGIGAPATDLEGRSDPRANLKRVK